MKHTVIDIRKDGVHVVPDPRETLVHSYDPGLLAIAQGAIPMEMIEHDTEEVDIMPVAAAAVETAFRVGTSSALGAFFDAVLAEGFELGLAQRLLGAAFDNMKSRTPLPIVRGLFEDCS